MATIAPTFAQTWTQITQINKTFHAIYRSAVDGGLFSVAANAYTTQEGNVITGLNTTFARAVLDALDTGRSALGVVVGAHRSALEPYIFELGRAINSDAETLSGIVSDLYDYMIANSDTVESRTLTPGTITAGGSNVGDGTLLRYQLDAQDYTDHRQEVGTLTFRCIGDRFSGTVEGRESFAVFGDKPISDDIEEGEGGIRGVGTSIEPSGEGSTDNRLANAGFEGDTTITTGAGDGEEVFDSWFRNGTGGNLSALTIETTTSDVYHGDQSLQVDVSGGAIYLDQEVILPTATAYGAPWWLSLFAKKSAGATGTLTLHWGNQSRAFDIATDLTTSYTQFTQDLTTTDLWLENFRPASGELRVGFEIEVTAGTVHIDNVYFGNGVIINGSGWLLSPGSRDAGSWRLDDEFTIADTGFDLDDGINYYWLYRHFGIHLPHDGSPTIADPTFT